MDPIIAILPFTGLCIICCAVLVSLYWILIRKHPGLDYRRKIFRQSVIFVFGLLSLIAMIFALPIEHATRNQLFSLIGIFLSGVIAFSSTNVVANFMAGILLRITKPFRTGDFIRIGEHFGRVSERGFFDTEIQSENRELISLPNTYLTAHPIVTIRNSGTIISVQLSLGYDLHHSRIESLLIRAASEAGLEEPYVHIMELGNYSITYRVSGVLTEVKRLLTARSNLFRSVLEVLHGERIEIMSPAFMNQRRLDPDSKTIPGVFFSSSTEEVVSAETIVFDKAEHADQLEKKKQSLIKELSGLEQLLSNATDAEKERLQKDLERIREELKGFEDSSSDSG